MEIYRWDGKFCIGKNGGTVYWNHNTNLWNAKPTFCWHSNLNFLLSDFEDQNEKVESFTFY